MTYLACQVIKGSKPVISGQIVRGTGVDDTCCQGIQRKQILDQWTESQRTGINDLLPVEASEEVRDQWTEWPRTGINDLLPVEAWEETNPCSVDRMPEGRNQ